jgi:hypothetical protein
VDYDSTLRNDAFCRLQTWFADDTDHRLTAGKLLKILDKVKSSLASTDLEVDEEIVNSGAFVVVERSELILRSRGNEFQCAFKSSRANDFIWLPVPEGM